MAGQFIVCIAIRRYFQPSLGPVPPPEITLSDIYRSIVPFVLVMCFGLVLVMVFPQIALWLPQLYYGR